MGGATVGGRRGGELPPSKSVRRTRAPTSCVRTSLRPSVLGVGVQRKHRLQIPFKTAFIDAGEIAPRLRTCYSDTLEAPTSGSACRGRPGDVHSARDGWVATISARMAAFSTREFQARFGARCRSREGRQASRVDPMQQMLPFSLRSSPPSHLGRSGYLRGMLCDLRHIATPLDGLGAGTQSRRDLEVGDSL